MKLQKNEFVKIQILFSSQLFFELYEKESPVNLLQLLGRQLQFQFAQEKKYLPVNLCKAFGSDFIDTSKGRNLFLLSDSQC